MFLATFIHRAASSSQELELTLVNGQTLIGTPGVPADDGDAVPMFLSDSDYPKVVVLAHVVTAHRTGRVAKDLP